MSGRALHERIDSFDGGMNSGVDPLKLKANQVAYAQNASFRGDFFHTRPNFQTITLNFANFTDGNGNKITAATAQTNFQLSTALFQGACYFIPEGGTGSITLSIAGQLFYITPDANSGATVQQVFLPPMANGTSNPAALAQAWLWQSERWNILNDGQSMPIFFDGTTARRSQGESASPLGTSGQSFTVPPANQTAYVYLNSPYTGPVGVPILINAATYYLQSLGVTGRYPLGLSVISGNGDQMAPGTIISSNNKYLGTIVSGTYAGNSMVVFPPVPSSGTSYTQVTFTVSPSAGLVSSTAARNCSNALNFTAATASTTYAVGFGDSVSIGGVPCIVDGVSSNSLGQVTTLTVHPTSATNNGQAISGQLTVSSQSGVLTSFGSGSSLCSSGLFSGDYYSLLNSAAGTASNSLTTTAHTWNAGTSASPNYFTITLSNTFAGKNGDTLQIGAGGTLVIMKVVSYSGYTVTCQTVSGAGVTVPFVGVGSTPTANQILQNTSATGALTAVATYPSFTDTAGTIPNVNMTLSSSFSISILPSATPPTVGQIVQATASGNTDLLLVTSVSAPSSGSATLYPVNVENLTDQPGNTVSAGAVIYPIPELPPGKMGVYGLGRNWLALPDGVSYIAGDIVGGASGSPAYKNRDSVLKVSENEYLAGGGAFRVPGNTGIIQAMQFSAQLDASLGQGPLMVLTNLNVFSCNAPVDRTTWQSMSNPIQSEALIGSGGISQNAISPSSGDILFRASDGTIRSLLLARLDFNRWGNTPVSREMIKLLNLENKALLPWSSSITFDNRFLLTANPTQASRGVYHPSIIALNFDPYSSMTEKKPAIYDGEWTGLNTLQLVTGIFNGVQRAFAICLSSTLANIELHEILLSDTPAVTTDDGNPVTSYFETRELDMGDNEENGPHVYKRLAYGELFIDQLAGNTEFQVFYQPDQWPGWIPWATFTVPYNAQQDPSFRPRVPLPCPDATPCDPVNNRPLREGYTFQVKIQITGKCRVLGGRFECEVIPQPEHPAPICDAIAPAAPVISPPAGPNLYCGVTPNPTGIISPANPSAVAFYYQDTVAASFWSWSPSKRAWNPIISSVGSVASGQFFTQGNQVLIGGASMPSSAPAIPTQPALYYQDKSTNVQLWKWSVSKQQWLPLVTGNGSNVTFTVATLAGTMYGGATASPSATPQPANGAALYIQDAITPRLSAWSILNQTWFKLIGT